jgi:hypothetical protein
MLIRSISQDRLRRSAVVVFAAGSFATLLACWASSDGETASPPAVMADTASNLPGAAGASGGATPGNEPPAAAANTGGGSGSSGGRSGQEMGPPVAGLGVAGQGDASGVSARGASPGGGAGGGTDADCSLDSDRDTVNDCLDGCPNDPFKVSPGACGCGQTDLDVDVDGTLDCREECDDDPNKTAPGVCGCGQPDVDSDGDGMLDCQDDCPKDATRSVSGTCGCGAPDNLPLCLRHRYGFGGAGTAATDSVGGANGVVVNTTLAGNGTVVLAGTNTDQYVDLPDGIVSSLGPNATIEVWFTWTGAGAPWQRVFDFGSSDQPPGAQGTGATYLFVTPSNGLNSNARAAFTTGSIGGERVVDGPAPLTAGVLMHIAVVIDAQTNTLTYYQNGARLGGAELGDVALASLNDVNNWIGRSQFTPDEELQATIDEVRIYGVARNAAQVASESAAGPNVLPTQ